LCFSTRLPGGPYNLRLVNHLVGAIGDSSDIDGTWTFVVHLTDAVRDASVDLPAKFDYRKPAAN
jgi:hypothetical protein